MSDKRGDRYYGIALRRSSLIMETSKRLSDLAVEAESLGDELLEIANKSNDSKLREIANKLLYSGCTTIGWMEGA